MNHTKMEEYFYEVNLSWKGDKKGHLSSHGMQEIEIISPVEPKTEKRNRWTPEHLMAGAISSCFMTTYLDIAENTNLELLNYHSQCFVKLEKTDDKFIATEVLLRPIIYLKDMSHLPKALLCLEEAESKCTMQNTLNIHIDIHPEFKYAKNDADIKNV